MNEENHSQVFDWAIKIIGLVVILGVIIFVGFLTLNYSSSVKNLLWFKSTASDKEFVGTVHSCFEGADKMTYSLTYPADSFLLLATSSDRELDLYDVNNQKHQQIKFTYNGGLGVNPDEYFEMFVKKDCADCAKTKNRLSLFDKSGTAIPLVTYANKNKEVIISSLGQEIIRADIVLGAGQTESEDIVASFKIKETCVQCGQCDEKGNLIAYEQVENRLAQFDYSWDIVLAEKYFQAYLLDSSDSYPVAKYKFTFDDNSRGYYVSATSTAKTSFKIADWLTIEKQALEKNELGETNRPLESFRFNVSGELRGEDLISVSEITISR